MEKHETEHTQGEASGAPAKNSSWQGQSKKGFDKVWGWAMKLGGPVNKLTNKLGSEAFFPTSLDQESYKAARILRSFCKDGFYAPDDTQESAGNKGPKSKPKVLQKIPQQVIQNAVGLAIFTTMRTGLHISGAGGSGILVARTPSGGWSPPSGILLHTAGFGLLVGFDVYDCVLVINTREALESFTKVRATIGGELSATAGPVGAGGSMESSVRIKQEHKPVYTYMKSRGFYAGLQIDGTIVVERTDENAIFYKQEKIGVRDILAGNVQHVPPELRMLEETLKAAEGRTDVNEGMMDELDQHPVPGDAEVEAPKEGEKEKLAKEFADPNTGGHPGGHPVEPPPYSEHQPPAQAPIDEKKG